MNLKNYNDEELRVILRFLKDQEQDRKVKTKTLIKIALPLSAIIAGLAVGLSILSNMP